MNASRKSWLVSDIASWHTNGQGTKRVWPCQLLDCDKHKAQLASLYLL
jgi:hypothetical protein